VGTAALPVREIARLAQASIECASERLELGDVLLIFPEGTRSREQAMQPGLAAVARYFDPDAVLVPVALMGSQHVMTCADDRLRRATVSLQLGEPIEASALEGQYGRSPQRRVDAVCSAIARLLDPEYRGVYAAEG
jgi:1-acyl-sn-glycerol-3-phosphate acyltransferase